MFWRNVLLPSSVWPILVHVDAKWLGRKEYIGYLEVIWPLEQWEGDTARTCTESRGVSSKNGPINVQ